MGIILKMLYDYQIEMLNKIKIELKTHNGVCCVLPCRSGKSYIMAEICNIAESENKKVLILAHRNILIEQHKKLIKNCRIASVFTEVNHLGENGMPDLIIIDEAHISGCESYQKVCEFYKCKRILFTATAERLDGKPLNLADIIINGVSADELIKRGYISPYNLYAPKLNFNLKNVSMSGNDFNNNELSEVMIDKKIYGDIIKYYNLYAKDKQAIAYCTNIKHSQSICELFNENGISAMEMNASTPEKTRNQIMDDFKNNKFKILCNCNLISEGITVPNCDCCLLLRPTQSETLYIQQSNRCLTAVKGKTAVIIDYVGNCFTHGMPTEKRIYSLNEVRKTQNPNREPDILTRQCKNCFKIYAGNNRICPYCNFDNGKTKKQIEDDKNAELERITEINKIKDKNDLREANKSYENLVAYGKRKGYKNGWAWIRWQVLQKYKNK